MKVYAVLALSSVALTAVAAAILIPVMGSQKITAKRASPEAIRQRKAEIARQDAALEAFRRNDPAQRAEARALLMSLPKGDRHRPAFAALLAARGETQAAFETEKVRARTLELSLPDDKEMEFYATLAERAGHPDEAVWARARMGAAGHYRVWRLRIPRMFEKRGSEFPGGRAIYETLVNHQMDNGIRVPSRVPGRNRSAAARVARGILEGRSLRRTVWSERNGKATK